jgi:hypothetical protein
VTWIKPIKIEGEVEVNDTPDVVMRSLGTDEAETLVSLVPGASMYVGPDGTIVVMPPGAGLVTGNEPVEASSIPSGPVTVTVEEDPRRARVLKMLRNMQGKVGPDAPGWLSTDLSRTVRELTRSL